MSASFLPAVLAALGLGLLAEAAIERPLPRPGSDGGAALAPGRAGAGVSHSPPRPAPRTGADAAEEDEYDEEDDALPAAHPVGAREAAGEPAPVCGSASVIGRRLPPIEDPGRCGVPRPVEVHSVAGVALDPPPRLACATALTLADWLEAAAKPAFLDADGDAALERLGVAAAYVCRNVNYAEDGDLSEHARGLAIDIARFGLADGREIAVLGGWDDARDGPALRAVLEAACGPFRTVLGPDSDEWHADHFHLGLAPRRRPYCP